MKRLSLLLLSAIRAPIVTTLASLNSTHQKKKNALASFVGIVVILPHQLLLPRADTTELCRDCHHVYEYRYTCISFFIYIAIETLN